MFHGCKWWNACSDMQCCLQGTTYVYHSLLRPFVAKHESEIDQNLNELRTRAGDVALLWWQRGSVYVQTRFVELLQFLASQSDRARQVSVSTEGAPGAPPRPSTQGPPRGRPQVRLLLLTSLNSWAPFVVVDWSVKALLLLRKHF